MSASACVLEIDTTVEPCTPMRIDQARMRRCADDLLTILAGYLPPEAHVWFEGFRPDVARYLAEAERMLRDCARQGDRGSFAAAIRFCTDKYSAAVRIYQMRERWMTYSGTLTDGQR